MARNFVNSVFIVVCLCLMIVFLVGCNNCQQVKLEQKPEADNQVIFECEKLEQEQIANTFFETYPENWEHYSYQQNRLAQYTKNSTPSMFRSVLP